MFSRLRAWTLTAGGLWALIITSALVFGFLLRKLWLDTVGFNVKDDNFVPKWVELNVEMFKTGLQLFGVGVIGFAANVLYERYRRHREKREARREIQRQFLVALVAAYQQTKQHRRVLRARAFETVDGVELLLPQIYDEKMELVSQCQLSFEALIRQVKASKPDHFPERDNLIDNLRRIEVYLGDLVSEWEATMPLLRRNIRITRTDMTRLGDFVGRADETSFRQHVTRPYDDVHGRVSKWIQNGDLAGDAVNA